MIKKQNLALILIVVFAAFTLVYTVSQTQVLKPDGEEKYELMASDVMAKLSELRGLDSPEKFEVKTVTSDWVKENWGRSQSVEEPLEWKIYKSLLLVPAEASFAEFEQEWAGYILAAASGTTLYIVVDIVERVEDKIVLRTLAHELTHILQFVNFEIVASGVYDSDEALGALIEGDADLSADTLLIAEGFELEDLKNQDVILERLDYKRALILMKSFRYQYGEGFATYLWEQGGWVLLDEAYKNPPPSMEQVIHPEKYLQSEGYNEPDLLTPVGEEWNLRGGDRLGEYSIRIFLARWIEHDTAKAASEGWNGDRVAYYEADGDSLLAWATIWDSEKDAVEFYDATVAMLANAGGEQTAEDLWKVNDIYLALKLSANTVHILSSNNFGAIELVYSKSQSPT